jgi:acyl carrier protein
VILANFKMQDTEAKLRECLSAVFPEVPQDRLTSASAESLGEWDSMAAIRLMRVLEDEFGIEVDFEDLERLRSFRDIERYVSERVAAS